MDNIQALKQYRQFINWKIENGVKVPVNSQGFRIDAHSSSEWVDYDTCAGNATNGLGIAFVFTEQDPFFFVDIDKCLEPGGQSWSPLANQIMQTFAGAAIEVSTSRTGLHIIATGQAPEHSCKNTQLKIELYTEKRFVALTGLNMVGDASARFDSVLPGFVNAYFPPKVTDSVGWTTTHCAESSPIENDNQLIKIMLDNKSASAAFGGRASFSDLWNKNIPVLSEIYSDESREFDASSADAALAQHLAFWTGNNCERIERLMKQSRLVRDKWNRDDYMQRTILNACSMQTTFFKKREVEIKKSIKGPELVTGFQYLGITQQLELFKGCAYIQTLNKIFCPNGLLLNQEQFNSTYGGYVFQVDDSGERSTDKAWRAFTNSQCIRWPKIATTCFRPELEPGEIIEEDGLQMINTYIPIETPKRAGDVTPFLNHLKKILPIERDQQILLAYMAACIQYKGVKFQWCPVLQGAEGNGKTLFTRCVAFAVGKRYTHLPQASEIGEKFNEWLFNKIFIGVEEIYVPESKREVMEILKPMITNEDLAMRAMQASQVMGDNRANFIFNSNHKTGLRKSKNDRRLCIFYCAQQTVDDLIRDGMKDTNYFTKLYNWLKLEHGYEIVSHYLEHYDIPDEFNPATKCQREPGSSSTQEAVAAGLGSAEQEILEAVEQGKPGFAGGWISSMAMARLLDDLKLTKAIPINKRREILQALDYDWHPGLTDGRANNYVNIDGGKPRLFIKKGHIHSNLTLAAEIVRQYEQAQGPQAIQNNLRNPFIRS
jgi:hypothetical protein